MDEAAIEQIVAEWFEELMGSSSELAWLVDTALVAFPAFLVNAKTSDGGDYEAGAVSVRVAASGTPDAATVSKLRDALVADRTLRGRAKRATYEPARSDGEVGTIVVIPR